MNRIGICFSKDLIGEKPLDHIGTKTPVYLKLLDYCLKEKWEVYVLTKKTYLKDGIFKGGWKYNGKGFKKVDKKIKIDLVYDRTGGVKFPPKNTNGCYFVNDRDFKILAWDKWLTYKILKEYMPKTYWVGDVSNIYKFIRKIDTKYIVVKPHSGLKGKGIFIGHRDNIKKFNFLKGSKYIIQEFVDTSKGINNIVKSRHDLRVVVVNGKPIWCHVREPQTNKFLANVGQGGKLTEIDYGKVPDCVKKVIIKITKDFYERYDNPIYSVDFGIDEDGDPKIFEINDQIGFPHPEMKNADRFVKALVVNFKEKLNSQKIRQF